MTQAEFEAPIYPAAGMERRFYAFLLDRLLVWALYAVAIYAIYRWLIEPGYLWSGLATIAGIVLLLGELTSLLVGLTGATPAMSLLGVRVASAETGGVIGVPRAMLRTLLLGAATLPTLGFGVAALAWTAVMDPTGRRRGWHDLRAGSVVVDVRPAPVEPGSEVEPPSPLVNLTAMRLVPASPTPPTHVPARRSGPLPKPLPPRLSPTTPSEPSSSVSPRQGLGWPLVGSAPEGAGAPPSRPASLGPTPPPPPPLPLSPSRPPLPVRRPRAAATPDEAAAEQAPPRPEPPAPARARWQVGFDTGEQFEVSGLTLLGRRPEARPGEPVKQLVTLPSHDMSLSKTHAQFQVVPDGALVVMDRGSTNGSILIRAGVSRRLSGGRPATLRDGDKLRFGDREMTVSRLT